MTEIVAPRLNLNYVDALLGIGPHWNSLPAHDNTIRFTFAASNAYPAEVEGVQAFTPTQQANARTALAYISALTGIRFVETADAAAAQVHLACADILDPEVAGVCISSYSYTDAAVVNDYTASSYVYIDNNEWFDYAGELLPGTEGYELLLHELGHMLGLKHPFETAGRNSSTLPDWLDHTGNTLMSYTSQGGPYAVFGQYDIAALMWLYGGDGLGGKLGVGASGGYWMGSTAPDVLEGYSTDDMLQGAVGDDFIDGGSGIDTAVFSGPRDSYEIVKRDFLEVTVRDLSGQDGTDRVRWVELFQFSDGIFTFAQVTNADVTPPLAPVLSIQEAAGKVSISGMAEPNTSVEVFYSLPQANHFSIGIAHADASGAWSLAPRFFDNNSYVFYASATDVSGNVSAFSAEQPIVVDAVIPAIPTLHIEQGAGYLIGGTRPVLYGTAHPGSTVEVFVSNAIVASTIADAHGNWQALGAEVNASTHMAWVVATTPEGREMRNWETSHIRVDPAAGFAGTDAGDTFSARDGNNTYSGGGGADTLAYAGLRAAYTVAIGERGVTVIDAQGGGGTDTLFSVERLRFGDAHVAVDVAGIGGQAYRIYNTAFDRPADLAGVGFWMAQLDKGVSLRDVAAGFMQSEEFIGKYGANPTNQAFVETVYQNVLNRAGDTAGINYWVDSLNNNVVDRAWVMAFFSESAENIANLAAVIGNGFPYEPYV